MPWDSHTVFTANQNWSRSSFPKPLNNDNFTKFTMLNCGGGDSGVGEVVGDSGEDGGGVGGWGIRKDPFFIN